MRSRWHRCVRRWRLRKQPRVVASIQIVDNLSPTLLAAAIELSKLGERR